MELRRHLTSELELALADTPVVLLNGARQTGKSTLARQWVAESGRARYLTLDDSALYGAARADPAGFLAGLPGDLVIDEVQRVPELFREIKRLVDEDRRPGRFLLTGSADPAVLPEIAQSLAGRVEILTLWPLSLGELAGRVETLVDDLFAPDFASKLREPASPLPLWLEIVCGGFPEVQKRQTEGRRASWFESYLETTVVKEVIALANIEGWSDLPRLFRLLASRAGSLSNLAEVARSSQLPATTVKRYQTLLEATFLVRTVPAWSRNLGKRLVRSPKLYLADSGLLAYAVGITNPEVARTSTMAGKLLENFVFQELSKQRGWSQMRPELFHYRTHPGDEVDFVLETRDQRVVGIEVKAAASVSPKDFKGLRALKADAGSSFVRGVIFYTGRELVPFAADLYALPLSLLGVR